jgi:hypothetical protein
MTIGLKVLVSPDEIEQLKEYWRDHVQVPEINWEAYWSVIRERKTSVLPYVIGLFEDADPKGMLIGRIELGWVTLRFGYWKPIRISVRKIVVPGKGLIAEETEHPASIMVAEVIRGLRERRADIAVFEYVETGSALYRAARTAPIGFLMRDHMRERRLHWRLDLPPSFEEYHRAHRGLMQKVRKLERTYGGRIQYSRFCYETDVDRFCVDVEDIAKTTYQRALGVGFLNSREDRAKLSAAARLGQWEAFVTYIDGRAAAFWSGSRIRETLFLIWTGYDIAYQNCSPGLVSFVRMLEILMAEGVHRVDFGGGDAPYKERLSTKSHWEESVCMHAPTLKGFATNVVRQVDAAIANVSRTRLKKLAIQLKSPWRRRLARRISS